MDLQYFLVQVEAVAARDLSKAREFAERFGIKRSYGSYEELAKDKDLGDLLVSLCHMYVNVVKELKIQQTFKFY